MDYHTQGPWLAEPADMFGDHNIVLADSAGDSRAVAAVVSNMRDPLEVAANALLAASAPTMLKAFQILRDHFDGVISLGDDEAVARLVRDTIRAATFSHEDVAKVRGMVQ